MNEWISAFTESFLNGYSAVKIRSYAGSERRGKQTNQQKLSVGCFYWQNFLGLTLKYFFSFSSWFLKLKTPSFRILGKMSTSIRSFLEILKCYGIEPEKCSILDIGCGNGKFTLELGKIFGRVVTIDSQPDAIRKLKCKIADMGLLNISGMVVNVMGNILTILSTYKL